ncbi:MAG: hypothetical protein KTR24_06175 [Saprospiraceae bacterium]|nr:hypothetical protein [Saprospiraceae bacterium]
MVMQRWIFIVIQIILSGSVAAQSSLLDMLEDGKEEKITLTTATFKGSRLINGHTLMTRRAHTLEFLISHRFGLLNSGAYELFGLDNANVRFGLDYGVTDGLTIGFGRNSFEKTYDGFAKLALVRQQTGARNLPFSVTAFSSIAVNTLRAEQDETVDFSERVAFAFQGLIGRKFSPIFSLQIMPTLIHFNKVTGDRKNDLFAVGIGSRLKLSKRFSLNAEYYYRLAERGETNLEDSFALGVDLETGGHVFQFQFTNSRSMIEKGFIRETTGNYFSGDIHFGFNITRSF